MVTVKGFTTQMALGIQADFRNAVTVDELVPFTSESMSHEYVEILNDVLDGQGGRKVSNRGGKSVSGSFDVDVVIDEIAGDKYGIEALLLATLGSASFVSPRTQYTVNKTLNTYLTIVLNHEVSLIEYIGCKFNGLIYTVAMGAIPKITFNFLAYDRLITGQAGITNTAGDVTGLSPTNNDPTKHLFDKGLGIFRIGDDANALAAADEKSINSFTLNFTRNLSSPTFATEENTGHTDAEKSIEFIEDGFRDVTLTFDVPHKTADTYEDWWDDEELLQLDLKFTRNSMEHNIFVPTLKITNVGAPIAGPGIITQSVTAKCFRQHSDNSYMKFSDGATAIGEEFGIECRSNRTAEPS